MGSTRVSRAYAGPLLFWGSELPTAVAEVIAEATRSNNDPIGRPLPLASSWEFGTYKWWWAPTEGRAGTYNDPATQFDMLSAGHHWLPVFQFPKNTDDAAWNFDSYWDETWDIFASWHIPFTMGETQWERSLYDESTWFDLPAATNPNVFRNSDQVIIAKVDPMGPTTPWTEVGAWWMGDKSTGWENIQGRYPDPPCVTVLSNNEANTLEGVDAETSKRFVDAHGTGNTLEFKNEKVVKGYETRYNLMFDGMLTTLAEDVPAWAENAVMVGYNAVFRWFYARWSGWDEFSRYFADNIDYEKNYWGGSSLEYYLNPWQGGATPVTDYTVFSPQVEFMNTKWQLDLVYATHPDFWYEMSIWDGYEPDAPTDPAANKRYWYEQKGDPFTPARYKAWIQYGMWLTKPRVVREFRGWNKSREDNDPAYTMKLIEAVDDVYADPVKTRFWRNGTVVANTARAHPYDQNEAPEYASIDRWFNLTTNLDPGGRWTLKTELPVFALALVIGTTPDREWLIYAYSPKQDRADVHITVPDYGDVTIDVPQAGVFHYISER